MVTPSEATKGEAPTGGAGGIVLGRGPIQFETSNNGLIEFSMPVQCCHPQCQTRPWLKRGYIVNSVPIGKICMATYGRPMNLEDF